MSDWWSVSFSLHRGERGNEPGFVSGQFSAGCLCYLGESKQLRVSRALGPLCNLQWGHLRPQVGFWERGLVCHQEGFSLTCLLAVLNCQEFRREYRGGREPLLSFHKGVSRSLKGRDVGEVVQCVAVRTLVSTPLWRVLISLIPLEPESPVASIITRIVRRGVEGLGC